MSDMVSHSRENYWLDNVLISYLGSWRLLEDESSGTNGVDRPFSQMRDGYTPSDYSDKPYPWYFPRNQADRGRTVFKNGCLSYLTWHINETYHRQHIFSLKKKMYFPLECQNTHGVGSNRASKTKSLENQRWTLQSWESRCVFYLHI